MRMIPSTVVVDPPAAGVGGSYHEVLLAERHAHSLRLDPDKVVFRPCEKLPYTTLIGAYVSCISGYPSWCKSIAIAVARSKEYRLVTESSRSCIMKVDYCPLC